MGNKGKHANFLGLQITTEDGTFAYKLFDKRNRFTIFIFCMPVLSINITSSHKLHCLIPRTSEPYLRNKSRK